MHHVTSYVQEGLNEVIKTQNLLTRRFNISTNLIIFLKCCFKSSLSRNVLESLEVVSSFSKTLSEVSTISTHIQQSHLKHKIFQL